jgi:hypothetical protein
MLERAGGGTDAGDREAVASAAESTANPACKEAQAVYHGRIGANYAAGGEGGHGAAKPDGVIHR